LCDEINLILDVIEIEWVWETENHSDGWLLSITFPYLLSSKFILSEN